jgi:hypothetical protein
MKRRGEKKRRRKGGKRQPFFTAVKTKEEGRRDGEKK